MPESFKVDIIADATDVQNKITTSRANLKAFVQKANVDSQIKLRLDIATLREELIKANAEVRKFRQAGDQDATITAQLKAEGLRTQLGDAKKALSDLERQATSTGKSFFSLNGIIKDALKAFGGLYLIREFASGLKSAFDAAVSFESAFAGVRKTLDATDAELSVLSDQFRQLAKEIPISVEALAGIGELAGQLGVAKEDIIDFTKTIASIAVSSNLTEEQAASSFARIANIFQTPASEVDKLASSVIELGNNFATTESEIVDFATRIAGAGKVVGLQQSDIVAIGTAFTSVGVEAEAGGTAVQKALFSINDAVNTGGADLEKFAKISGVSASEFSNLWKTDAAKGFDLFVQGLGRQGDDATSVLEELVAGDVRLQRAFLSVAGAGDLLTRAISTSSTAFSENSALTEEANKRFETTESRMQLVANRFNDLKITLGDTLKTYLVPFLEGLIDLAEALFANGEKLRGLATLIKAVGIAFSSYLGAKTLLAIGSAITTVDAAIVKYTANLKKANTANTAFGGGMALLRSAWVALSNPVVAATVLIGLAITAFVLASKRAKELQLATDELTKSLDELAGLSLGISQLTDEFDRTLKKVQDLAKEIKALNSEDPSQRFERFQELDAQQGVAIQELRDSFTELSLAMGASQEDIDAVTSELKFFRRETEPTKKDIEAMQNAFNDFGADFIKVRDQFQTNVDRLLNANGDLKKSVDDTVESMRSGWEKAGKDVDKLSKELINTLVERSAETEGIGEAFTTGFELGLTREDIVASLQNSVGDITDNMLGTLLNAAIIAEDRGEVFGLLFAAGVDADSAHKAAYDSGDNLASAVSNALANSAAEARGSGQVLGSNASGGVIEGLQSQFPALNTAVNAVKKVLGAFGGFDFLDGIVGKIPGLKTVATALQDLGNKSQNVLNELTAAQNALTNAPAPDIGGGGGSGGGGASDALREAEQAAKDAQDAVEDYQKSIEDTNKASQKLRDDIRDFYDDINDSIDSAREKQAELNDELDDFKAEETRNFVEDSGRRDFELSEEEADVRQQIADLANEQASDEEDALRIAEEKAELEQELNDILKERQQIQEYLAGIGDKVAEAQKAYDEALASGNEEQIKQTKEALDNAKALSDAFAEAVRREGLTEFEQTQLSLQDKLDAKEAEIQAEYEKQQRIIDIQEQFLAVQNSNDQDTIDARNKLYDIANGDVQATAEERAALLAQLGFEDLTRQEELDLLQEIQRGESLRRELEAVEAQQAELLAVQEDYFKLAEQAHADSVDNMKAKTQELIDIIKAAQIEQEKLNALQAATSAASGSSTTNTTVNVTNNNSNNVDADIANQQLLDKI